MVQKWMCDELNFMKEHSFDICLHLSTSSDIWNHPLTYVNILWHMSTFADIFQHPLTIWHLLMFAVTCINLMSAVTWWYSLASYDSMFLPTSIWWSFCYNNNFWFFLFFWKRQVLEVPPSHKMHKVSLAHTVSFWPQKLTHNVSFWGQRLTLS